MILGPHQAINVRERYGRTLIKSIQRGINDLQTTQTIRRLRDRLVLPALKGEGMGRSIGFSGPVGGEGSTFLSILLSLSMTEVKRNRVIFIDARFEQKTFNIYQKMFSLARNGLSFTNSFGQFNFYSSKSQNLFFMSTGAPVSAMDLFSRREVESLMGELRKNFDFLIFDMPPLLSASEARMILPHLDLFYLVCTPDRTRTTEIEESVKVTEEIGARINGVVLNRQKLSFWRGLLCRDMFY